MSRATAALQTQACEQSHGVACLAPISPIDATNLDLNDPILRRQFLGGSDARIIMGEDEKALRELWLMKRGERGPRDYSDNLVVQLGVVTENLNRQWFERSTGHAVGSIQTRIFDQDIPYLAATLDGLVMPGRGVFEAKFMLPWSFSEEAAAAKHMAQLQHNMRIAGSSSADLSIITGGGKWILIRADRDPLYQSVLLEAELDFWDCVTSGREPRLVGAPPPPPKAEIVRLVDMTASHDWELLASTFLETKPAYDKHLAAKDQLKMLVPEGAQEAIGHGVRAKRSKSGAISFDAM